MEKATLAMTQKITKIWKSVTGGTTWLAHEPIGSVCRCCALRGCSVFHLLPRVHPKYSLTDIEVTQVTSGLISPTFCLGATVSAHARHVNMSTSWTRPFGVIWVWPKVTFCSAHLPTWVEDGVSETAIEQVLVAGQRRAGGSVVSGMDANCNVDDEGNAGQISLLRLGIWAFAEERWDAHVAVTNRCTFCVEGGSHLRQLRVGAQRETVCIFASTRGRLATIHIVRASSDSSAHDSTVGHMQSQLEDIISEIATFAQTNMCEPIVAN